MRALPAVLLVLFAGMARGQTSPRMEFEVASVKASAALAPGQLNIGMHIDGAQFRCAFFSLKDYIRSGYKVKDYQITGPDWIASQRFDITAKLPAGATREQVPEMMQSLLAERFHLKFHRETKDFPVYALIVGKGGLKIKETPVDPVADAASAGNDDITVTAGSGRPGATVNLGKGASFTMGINKIECKKLTMAAFAETLARFADRPIVDMTGLKGNYDLQMDFSPEDFRTLMIRAAIAGGVSLPPEALKLLDNSPGDALFSVIQTLGLKLEARKAPLEVLVVDSVDKTPTEN